MESGVTAVVEWLRAAAREFDGRVLELNDLDRLLGDGDHGTNMHRGFHTAQFMDFDRLDTPNEALRHAGMALVSVVGGASGPLFGTFLLRSGAMWPREKTTASIATAVRAGLDGIVARGKAEPGDKTMVDALAPAVEVLERAAAEGVDLQTALAEAAAAAEAGRDRTADMVARRGRAALRASDSLGVLDPGAVSMAVILRTAAEHIS
ncbi:MAG: dihydroxyacetone kinase subunit DhaL [Arachnia sp.]